MIVFGVAVTEVRPFEEYCKPGIDLVAEPDSELIALSSIGTFARGYNLLLEAAAAREDLEALVIVDPFTRLADPNFCAKVRSALADPAIAIAGCAGASDVQSIAWWEGRVSAGDVTVGYHEHGGGRQPAFPWLTAERAPRTVDTVDGCLLVLSPWAVRNLAFDESLRFGYGHDLDLCLQARAAARTVATIDTSVVIHRSLELIENWEVWIEAHAALAAKWEGRAPWPVVADDVRLRARRAEAQAEAAHAVGHFRRLAIDARVAELQRTVDEAAATVSWRATRPLRELNRLRRMQRQRRRTPAPRRRAG